MQVNKLSRTAQQQRFCAVTNASKTDASNYLRTHNYQLEVAIDAYLRDESAQRAALSPAQEKTARKQLGSLFDRYKGLLRCSWQTKMTLI